MSTLEERIAQAVGDPGSILERAPDGDSYERVSAWSTRAVLAVLRETPPDRLGPLLQALGMEKITHACGSCTLHPGTRYGWCASGCGRDYNEIRELKPPVYRFVRSDTGEDKDG